jgi:hypothetical protein
MKLLHIAALSGVALLALAATAACGDDDSDDPTPTTSATSPTATESHEGTSTRPPATATRPAETPSGGAPAHCTADDLTLSALNAGAAAGTHFFALSVKNVSADDCSLNGYPGVSLTDASGEQLGAPTERNPAVAATPVVLAPGEAAHAMVGLPNHQNFPAGSCEGPSASLVMYPPDETEAMTVPFEDYACPGFSVRVFEPGANEAGR